jgi:hypothetical protein
MQLGAVSNCWKAQLQTGTQLTAIIETAQQHGLQHIELRQTCLGQFESREGHIPLAKNLPELPQQFSEMTFNLAIAFSFLSPTASTNDPLFQAARLAAQALAPKGLPHLRLVDLQTTPDKLNQLSPQDIGQNIAQMVLAMSEVDGILSVENSIQPWPALLAAIRSAQEILGPNQHKLKLCYDPANLFYVDDGIEPSDALASLSASEISMVHFKQRQHNKPLAAVAQGDVDWEQQLAQLKTMNYNGPALFEIESTENIWENLTSSQQYLERCGLSNF